MEYYLDFKWCRVIRILLHNWLTMSTYAKQSSRPAPVSHHLSSTVRAMGDGKAMGDVQLAVVLTHTSTGRATRESGTTA